MRSITADSGPSGYPAPPDPPAADLSGRAIGGSYLLIEAIGGGATGTVWRGVDRNSGAHVAIKLMRQELMRRPKAVTRFVQERSILLMLRHEHIVRVRDLLSVGDSLGLVMDLVPGGSLRDHLRRHGTLPPATAADLLAQVASALARAHHLGIVHRDLKPDNILLDHSPDDPAGTPRARLTDFGIARLLDSPGITTPEALVGTPNYLAPELINGGQPAPPVDVYALGVVLYELITGRAPYAGSQPMIVLRRHLEDAPTRHPGIPDQAWAVVLACLAKEPTARPDAEALVTTLRSLARGTVDAPALPLCPAPAPGDPSADEPELPGRCGPARRPPAAAGGVGEIGRAGELGEIGGLGEAPGGGGAGAAGPRTAPAAAGAGRAARAGGDPAGAPEPPGVPADRPGDAPPPAAPTGPTVGRRVGQGGGGRTAPRRSPRPRPGRVRPRAPGPGRWRTVVTAAALAMLATVAVNVPVWDLRDRKHGQVAAPGGPAPAPVARRPAAPEPTPARAPSPAPAVARTRAAAESTGPPPPVSEVLPTRRASRHLPPPSARVELRVYGPLRCNTSYSWDPGHPALAQPCHATGPKIRLLGRMQALPGVQADISLWLADHATGVRVAGPFTCTRVTFTDAAPERDCGPFDTPAERGRRYVVVQEWGYTNQRMLPGGSAHSDPFTW